MLLARAINGALEAKLALEYAEDCVADLDGGNGLFSIIGMSDTVGCRCNPAIGLPSRVRAPGRY